MKLRNFGLNRREAKFLGVCAGLADLTGIDATIIRIALVIGMVAGGWKWLAIAYFVAAFLSRKGAVRHREERIFGKGRAALADYNGSDIDRRLAEIDRFTAAQNTKLAREIDELR